MFNHHHILSKPIGNDKFVSLLFSQGTKTKNNEVPLECFAKPHGKEQEMKRNDPVNVTRSFET